MEINYSVGERERS